MVQKLTYAAALDGHDMIDSSLPKLSPNADALDHVKILLIHIPSIKKKSYILKFQ